MDGWWEPDILHWAAVSDHDDPWGHLPMAWIREVDWEWPVGAWHLGLTDGGYGIAACGRSFFGPTIAMLTADLPAKAPLCKRCRVIALKLLDGEEPQPQRRPPVRHSRPVRGVE